jgi:hypothetical protein
MMNPLKAVSAALLMGVLLATLVGCEKGPAEKAGENLDKAVEKAGENVDKAVEKVGESVEKAGENIQEAAKGSSN